jgi:glycosyltransferase involved in cell wall biosynthesis
MPHLFSEHYPQPINLPPPIIMDRALPLVSIVTPSYNQGQFIRETIESVLSQDYPNLEYWVIDSQSTDQTLNILSEYETDPRFHWISEPDRGQSDAINKGWSRCQGSILAWLCSDDLYCPGAIKTQVNYLLAHPEVDAVYSDAIAISADGKRVRKDFARPFSFSELLRIDFVPQATIFLRRSLIERTGPLDITLHYAMDHDYWLRSSAFGKFVYAPGEIAKYRLHPASKGVAHIAQFNPEIERVATHYFARLDVPIEIRQRQKRILADVMLMISINYVRAKQFSDAFRSYKKAVRLSLFRPRQFWLLMRLIEASIHIPFVDPLVENWFRLRSKFGSTGKS